MRDIKTSNIFRSAFLSNLSKTNIYKMRDIRINNKKCKRRIRDDKEI